MTVIVVLLVLCIVIYGIHIYLRERPPADPIKPTVPAPKAASDKPDKAG